MADGRSAIWVLSGLPRPKDDAKLSVKAIVVQKDAWDQACSSDDPPEDCVLVSGAMKLAGECILLELER